MDGPTQQQYQGYTCEAVANLVLMSMTFTANGVWGTAEGSLKCVGDDAAGRQQMHRVGNGALKEGRRVEIAWINTPQRGVCSTVEAEVYDGDTCIGYAKRLQTCPAHVRQKVTIDGWEHVSEEWALLPGAGFSNGGLLLADYHEGWTGPAMLVEFGDALAAVRLWQGVMRQRVDLHTRSPDLGTRMFIFAKRLLKFPHERGADKRKPGSVPLVDPPFVGYVSDVRSVSTSPQYLRPR